VTVIFFSSSFPNVISDELSRQGFVVYEALAISEVLALAEQYPEAHIIIASNIEGERVRIIQKHYPTLQLSSGATAAGIILELSHHVRGETIQ
jgi:hypothetical protein